MADKYDHLPADIAAEKRTASQMSRGERSSIILRFNYLRRKAPGIIAEFVLSVIITIPILGLLGRQPDGTGVWLGIGYYIRIVVIVAVCFWIGGRVWRAFGRKFRDRVRHVMMNIWSLLATAVSVTSFGLFVLIWVLSRLSPEFRERMEESQADRGTLLHERVFEGDGWRILRNEDFSYAMSSVEEAPARCVDLGEDWTLADVPDFTRLNAELKEGGHLGSYRTASNSLESHLDFFLSADRRAHYRWLPNTDNSARIVLCVEAVGQNED